MKCTAVVKGTFLAATAHSFRRGDFKRSRCPLLYIKVMLTLHLPQMWPWCMGAFLPSTDPVSVEATIDSYRRLAHKSSLLAFAVRTVFRLLMQIDQVA